LSNKDGEQQRASCWEDIPLLCERRLRSAPAPAPAQQPAPAPAPAPARSFVDSRVSPRERVLSPSCRRLAAAKMAKAPLLPAATASAAAPPERAAARLGALPPPAGGRPGGAKAELKEVVINNQHAGFEFDMPRKQKIDQQNERKT
uniref:PAM2 domain-containing protein n=1 Tax=Macrostomum lignano TaxID=282301 RepID=A0A1I8FNU4_9PLAT